MIGERLAYPTGYGFQLGIRTSERTMWSDDGRTVPLDHKPQVVANPINCPHPIPEDQLIPADWRNLLTAKLRCPAFGTQLLYGMWATIAHLSNFKAAQTPLIEITDDLPAHNLGNFNIVHGRPRIQVAKSRIYTYAALASIIAHETAHQIQRTVFNSSEESHGELFDKICREITSRTGIAIHRSVDFVGDRSFAVSDPLPSKYPIYYIIADGRVSYTDSHSEVTEIITAPDAIDADLQVYKSHDISLIDWLRPETDLKRFTRVRPDVLKVIAHRGTRIYP